MEDWKTPMGVKINCFEFKDDHTKLTDLIDLLKGYHKGLYVIGHDTTYCEQPHYHIHWWCEKEVSKGAVKTFRSTKIKGYDRSLKFYLGQDLPSSDKTAWLGYAVKENVVDIGKYPDAICSQIQQAAAVQKEIKILKQVHSEKLKEKDKVKKELKDKLFDSIKEDQEAYNDDGTLYGRSFGHIAPLFVKYYKVHAGKRPVKSVYESGTWDFLLDFCGSTELEYVRFFSGNKV